METLHFPMVKHLLKSHSSRVEHSGVEVRCTLGAGDDTAYWDFQHRKAPPGEVRDEDGCLILAVNHGKTIG